MRAFFASFACLVSVSAICSIARNDLSERTSALAATVSSNLIDPRDDGLEVGMGEWAVTLEAVSIRPGRVTFVIHNGGTRTHGFRIRSKSGRRGRDRFRARTRLIPAASDTQLTVNLPGGIYEVDCYVEEPGVGEHDELGMENTLTVRADAPLIAIKPRISASAVAIERFEFSPPVLKVPVGTTVAWTNHDPLQHTVTADDDLFDSLLLESGSIFSRVFDIPGTFHYKCRLHPNMQGRIEVRP